MRLCVYARIHSIDETGWKLYFLLLFSIKLANSSSHDGLFVSQAYFSCRNTRWMCCENTLNLPKLSKTPRPVVFYA